MVLQAQEAAAADEAGVVAGGEDTAVEEAAVPEAPPQVGRSQVHVLLVSRRNQTPAFGTLMPSHHTV